MSFTGNAKLAFVMGWPVRHSLSPALHNYWLEHYDIDGVYIPLAVKPGDCVDVVKHLAKMGFQGGNLTLPHKEIVLRAIEDIDETATRVGAVNTIVINEDGELTGTSTDGYGFVENLKQEAPEWKPAQGPVLVLGAGGAARSICVALADAGVEEIRVSNRTIERADHLCDDLSQRTGADFTVIDWEQRDEDLGEICLLVNTTSLGLEGQPALKMDLDGLSDSAVVADAVYVPLMTDLLTAAKKRGNTVVDGLGMLLHQARPGFKAWFGTDPEVNEKLRQHILDIQGGRNKKPKKDA